MEQVPDEVFVDPPTLKRSYAEHKRILMQLGMSEEQAGVLAAEKVLAEVSDADRLRAHQELTKKVKPRR